MIQEGRPKTVGRGFARQSRFSLSQDKNWTDIGMDVKRLSQCCFGSSLVKGIPDLRMIYEFAMKHCLYVCLFVTCVFLYFVFLSFIFLFL